MRALSIIALVAVANCPPPTAESIMAPDGHGLITVRCTSQTSKCFTKAREACQGQPYRVTDSYSNAGGVAADILPGPVTWYTMTLQCGVPGGAMPSFPFRGATYADALAALPPPIHASPAAQQASRPLQCTSTPVGYGVSTTCF